MNYQIIHSAGNKRIYGRRTIARWKKTYELSPVLQNEDFFVSQTIHGKKKEITK